MEPNNQIHDGNEDESLFEGMVLFDPFEIHPPGEQNHHDSDNPAPIVSDQQKSYSDAAPAVASDSASSPLTTTDSSSNPSEPLDENLFSDLTLVTSSPKDQNPPPISDPPQSISGSSERDAADRDAVVISVSRQISRRKKRPGLRIGYGRDVHTPPSPTPDLHSSHFNQIHGDSDDDRHSDALPQIQQPDPPQPQTLSPSGPSIDNIESTDYASQDYVRRHQSQQDLHPHQNDTTETETCTSPKFNLEQLKVQITEKLGRARLSVETVSSSRKDAIRRRRKIVDDLNLSSVRHSHLEKQLEEACEAEDFDTAERLSESLASAEGEKQAFLNALKDAEASCDAMDSRMSEVLDFLIVTEEECDSLLQNFATDASNNGVLALKTAEVESAKELEKWHFSNEVLEAKKMETEIESHIIHDSRLALNGSVELLVEDDHREKEALCQKKAVLTEELEKLLALVAEKKREIEINDSLINAVENRISDAISGFRHVRSDIDAKYDALQSTLSHLQLESKSLLVKRKEIDEFLALEEEKGAELQKLAQLSSEEAEAYREVARLRKFLMSIILKTREDKDTLSQSEDKLSKDVQMLQQGFHSARASLQELSSRKSTIQQDIATLKQRISFVDKRVPELEAEKKVAAAGRNFKEAARVAAEAKSLVNEKNSICTDIDRALLELERVEDETEGTMKRLRETEELIQSKEKEVAKARFQRLLLIAGTATAEGAAALELGDTDEATLLLAEGEAARCEAKKLGPVYNLHEDEFANIPKHFISMELVYNLGRNKLSDLVASIQHSTSDD